MMEMNPYRHDELVEKALAMIKGQSVKPDLATWRELAALSVGIRSTDALYRPMLDALTACDAAFRKGDWPAFWETAKRAKAVAARRDKKEPTR